MDATYTSATAVQPGAATLRPGGGTILDAIGNTPLIMVDGIWAKLEYLNPSGSIKARIAKYLIERAERDGMLRPGDTIVEASSGNTGNAMSMVAAVKGYRMLVVMPNGMSAERQAISRAFGAQVMTLGDFHVNDALAKVRELGCHPVTSRRSNSTRSGTSRRTGSGSARRRSLSFLRAPFPTLSSAASAPAAPSSAWASASARATRPARSWRSSPTSRAR